MQWYFTRTLYNNLCAAWPGVTAIQHEITTLVKYSPHLYTATFHLDAHWPLKGQRLRMPFKLKISQHKQILESTVPHGRKIGIFSKAWKLKGNFLFWNASCSEQSCIIIMRHCFQAFRCLWDHFFFHPHGKGKLNLVFPRTVILWESNYLDWVKQDCENIYWNERKKNKFCQVSTEKVTEAANEMKLTPSPNQNGVTFSPFASLTTGNH